MKHFTTRVGASLLALSVTLSGCIVIESSAISERTSAGSQPVSTSVSDYGVLALSVPNGLTQQANSQLASQCQSGKITNVQTELSMRNFIVVQLYNISVSGV